jgi:ribosomal protein L12E/L44/L45/RPP1/RPP2
MGIIVSVIVIGVAIASYITGNIVDDLKDQIQAIIKAHQNDVDTVKRLKVLVEKLDAKALKDAMKKMSESSRANFQTILSDQESKIALLKSMSVNED